MAFRKDSTISSNFSKITISLASPEMILERSSGEVLKPETINYRTYKPERDGLFCERIFGPVKDWECHCGKYKRIRYKGIVCDRCGVEVTEKKVRRERMGHIQLVVPVAHIWFFRSLPNKIGALLNLNTKRLDSIIYYERYVVVQPGIMDGVMLKEDVKVEKLALLTEEQYFEVLDSLPKENQYLDDSDPNKFVAKMGAEALFELLKNLDLDFESYELRHKANNETSQQRKADALKRLQVFEAFRDAQSRIENRPEWMIVKVVPVIPPELRPLVPLDGGRFATSDLNDLYRRVIIRNNRLKRLIEIKAPDVIMRNEKRMLQEAVDSLFDNSRKANSVKTESNRALKSLSDSLKGKQGRFRQNLLGKRVDYSGRSVIVVGPELKLNECGLPKDMASELFKPFIIRKMLERGIVKTVKSAKKIVDRKDPVVWDILENILKGHPVMLNRAPTLHRLGIQAFQPKLIEGKAIQLHPLVCTAFNADFDGDQMAVHVPLGNAAVLEAQLLMLASHNILNPANGAPITVPSQDMVLGLYYMTKGRKSIPENPVKGEGMSFYSPEEVIIAYNERVVDLHAYIKVRITENEKGVAVEKLIETTVGRVLFNQVVPQEYGYINQLLTKKALRDIIGDVLKKTGTAKTSQFLDDIKNLGYTMAFKGGLSFTLSDVIVPEVKEELVSQANEEVEEVVGNYNMGFITNNERYNQIIDIWTHTNSRLTYTLMENLAKDKQGFNPVYMMLDSGARGSKEQIRQLSGMRGLMAKPQKSGATGGEIIENPILSNFKEGLSVLEYFISTHGARKGLADTALKTADAGYLTRRLVDVAQDVVITEPDCGTLRGLTTTALKKNEEVVETLYDRILGRVTLHDIYHPQTGELIVEAGEELTEDICRIIEDSPIEAVEIRSVLTCESKQGVCAKCYGRNLASGKMVQKGEAVGVIAAQSIGEPGTQLTLRTFHVGGTASNISVASRIEAKYDGILEIDELRFVEYENAEGKKYDIVIGRSAEMRIVDRKTGIILSSAHIPYGANLYFRQGDDVTKGSLISDWDPYNAVILSEVPGKVVFDNIVEGTTYRVESDEQTGYHDKVIIESRQKAKNPSIRIVSGDGSDLRVYDIPVGSHIIVEEGRMIKAGEILVKIPRAVGKSGDITGGLPRVTELFEARNPSDPAIVAEIDGVVSFGKKLKRGNREVIITSKTGEEKSYLIPTSKQILAQENDYVKAGTPLSEGAMTPSDILAIKGPMKVQEYIVNEIQEVYRLQGVKINDKHYEVIVRQMMRKVEVADPGDTKFLEGELVNKIDFHDENDWIFGKKVVINPGDSTTLKPGQIVTARKLRDENSLLKRRDKKLVEARDAQPATAKQVLQGITRASLQTKSFISAASFQETTKVLTVASINAKSDELLGLKENVIVGHLIPAGTGLREYDDLIVGSKDEYEKLMASKAEEF
ncbi:DNA-directed RNA polymerase subunit beta' [Lentimicrobium sp.]|jgi:DNA-directed RNA polymerase subunit beta'|uniref:DNA-directed RNA polymerase subunit beta' n=1 Tax=Lentimicrobium sp. TaxID=2034841 RepID=UPI0025D6E9B3|nr:DNA-directed RNA polymerase subunit beta' [Lentimicrobium sp.]MCO5257308.1 DNA-directed RNA polymerase subunit beta' [Lentimicrobium sp.]MCO5261431.1 DNA-directed RNA polymerase subunit beta' [Lentimicrobium sp.]HPF64122.1 DNA-directed RNA polymerase subunit beta' [Lentimicrobium sp.]HPJ61862.1 DNA-directed RNA polymerase subunit beta' [Lentimicrobium sp.]HPR25568.1 DNA-directed RNA polymerase subunit beta' [Lentimicrobium sp.]